MQTDIYVYISSQKNKFGRIKTKQTAVLVLVHVNNKYNHHKTLNSI